MLINSYPYITLYYQMSSSSPNLYRMMSYIQPKHPNAAQMREDNQSLQEKFDNFSNEIRFQENILDTIQNDYLQLQQFDENFGFEFYPEFALYCVYIDDEQKKSLVSVNNPMNRLMTNLQILNNKYKQQLKSFCFEFLKLSKSTETLIEENKILRKYIAQKNKELCKLLTTINSVESTQALELKFKYEQCQQQNRFLLQHAKAEEEKIKKKQAQCEGYSKMLEQIQSNRSKLEQEKKKQQQKEQNITKAIQFQSQNEKERKLRHKFLLAELQRLKNIKQQYENDSRLIDKLGAQTKNQSDMLSSLREKYKESEQQREGVASTLRDLIRQYQEIITKNYHSREEQNRNQLRDQELSLSNRKLERKMQTYQKQIAEKEQLKKKCDQEQIIIEMQIDQIEQDIKQAKIEIQEKRKLMMSLNHQGQDNSKLLEKRRNEQVERYRKQLSISKKEASRRSFQQRNDIQNQKLQIKEAEMKISQAKQKLDQLLINIKEIRQKQYFLSQTLK